MRRAFATLSLALALTSCFPPGDGVEPPSQSVYFPVALSLDTDSRFLFVANSDFDLQFNAGVLQSYDLERVGAVVPRVCSQDADCGSGDRCDSEGNDDNGEAPSHYCVDETNGAPCGPLGESSAADRILVPNRCKPIDPSYPPDGGTSLLLDSVMIGAFATDVLFRAPPDDVATTSLGRLFVPVRGDTTLHWVDVLSDGTLECGQSGNDGECDAAHRAGDDSATENTRDLELPTEPFGVAATADGRAIVVTHQTAGAASLFVHTWTTAPRLEFVVTGMPSRPIGVSAIPVPEVVAARDIAYQPGFLVSFRNDASVHLLRFLDDGALSEEGSTPARPYLVDVGASPIRMNTIGVDSRGLIVDGSGRTAEESRCASKNDGFEATCAASTECAAAEDSAACFDACVAAQQGDCLSQAAAVPLDVYVANRTPPSLLLGRTRPAVNAVSSDDFPSFYDAIPLSAGPSRVVTGDVILADGSTARRVFVVCFDSSLIYVVDPVTRRVEEIIQTGRGPYAMAVDATRGLLYVAHFTDSFIGVFSIDQRVPETYGSMLATLGVPSPPRASK